MSLESGSMSPWLARALGAPGFAAVCMDARRAADAIKSRRVKSDKADAYALAEMLRTTVKRHNASNSLWEGAIIRLPLLLDGCFAGLKLLVQCSVVIQAVGRYS